MSNNNQKLYAVNKEIYPNLYYRKHSTRKYGVKYDRYFIFRYTHNKKLYVEGVGWESEGYKIKEIYEIFLKLKANRKIGKYPKTFKEYKESLKRENEAKMTLNKYWEIYFTESKKVKKKSSYGREEQQFRIYISPVAGDKLLEEISSDDYRKVLEKAKDKSPRTQKYILTTFRAILMNAYNKKYIKNEPESLKSIKIKKVNNERTRLITKEEKDYILAELRKRNTNAYNINLFCFLTGCRFGEAANLKWRDIDFANRKLVFRDTKNKDNRKLLLSKQVQEFLNTLDKSAEYVFLTEKGEKWKQPPDTFKTVAKPLNEGRAKNDRIVFHLIRHYVATILSYQLTLKELQNIMGWKDPKMALRYMKADEDRQYKALNLLGENIISGSKKIDNDMA